MLDIFDVLTRIEFNGSIIIIVYTVHHVWSCGSIYSKSLPKHWNQSHFFFISMRIKNESINKTKEEKINEANKPMVTYYNKCTSAYL